MGWRRRTLIIPNAGEVRVSRRGSVRMLSILLASLAPKTRVLWIGAGVPGRNSIWAQPYRLVARRAKLATFRDVASAELLGRGSVTPDWAFALGTNVENWTPAEGREKIALVLRGDRSRPSEDWLEWVRGLAKSHSLDPVVVAQVRRDNELAASLAEELNGQALLFEHDTPHSRQESLVREVYRQSSFVVGDRLHGLVVAATEGAIPIGWVESSSGKIKRHFDAIEMAYVGQFEGKDASILPDITEQDLDGWRLELRSRISQARSAIDSTLIAADEVAGRSPEALLYDGTLTDG
ncbi:polysaccharide pyruvyl transferase family protein [Alcanivoracaceae bacterium MT1]